MADQNDQGGVGQVFHRGVGDVLSIGLMLDEQREEGKSVDQSGELAALFTERVGIPTDDIFAFPLQPSTQATDSYSTRMTRQSLENYQRDAIAGTPFMNSHRTGGCAVDAELPLGQSFDGRLTGEPLDETPIFSLDEIPEPDDVDLFSLGTRLQTWDYMKRGLFPNGRNQPGTDDVISMIESKTLRQVSIGFGHAAPDRLLYRCGLCGNPVGQKSEDPERQCTHVPGLRSKETGHPAFAWVENGRMFEKSGVWAGATPGAIVGNAHPLVIQARMVAKNGLLSYEQLDRVEELYQTRVRPGQSFPAPGTRKPGEVNTMADEKDVKTSGEEEEIDGGPCSKTEVRTVKEGMAEIVSVLNKSTEVSAQLISNLVESNTKLAEALSERASEVVVTPDDADLDEQINTRFDEMQAEIDSLKGEQDADAVTARGMLVERVVRATIRAEGQQQVSVETLEKMLAVLDEKQLLAYAEGVEARNPFNKGRTVINPDLPGNGNSKDKVNPALFKTG